MRTTLQLRELASGVYIQSGRIGETAQIGVTVAARERTVHCDYAGPERSLSANERRRKLPS